MLNATLYCPLEILALVHVRTSRRASNRSNSSLPARRTITRLGSGDGGAVVTIASVAGLRGNAAIDPSYAVSKFAVLGLTQVAAAKLCKDKIRVNCVSPTAVDTVGTKLHLSLSKRVNWTQLSHKLHRRQL